MLRTTCILVVLLAPTMSPAAEKDKPAFLGIQIARGDTDGTFLIRQVIVNSPAEKAGLKGGDQLVRINGVKPTDLRAAVQVIRSLKPGKKVKLLIQRDGKEKTIEAVPGAAE